MQKAPFFSNDQGPFPHERKEHSLDLRSRIVDKGFTIRTMPSVKRPPTSSSTSRPLSAKIFSLKNKLAPVIYQQQSSILHLVQGEAPAKVTRDALKEKQTAKEESRITETNEEQKDEINALTKINQISYINKPPTVNKSELTLQRNLMRSSGGVGFGLNSAGLEAPSLALDRGLSQERKIYTSQTNFLRPNEDLFLGANPQIQTIITRNQSAGQFLNNLPPLSNSYLQKFGITSQTGFFKPKNLITDDLRSSLMTSNVNDGDLKRSKYLVDKISGKFRVDKRYLNTISQTGKTFGKQSILPEENLNLKTSSQQKTQNDEMNQGITNPQPKKNLLTSCKRPASRIDKYIDLILKNVTNLDEFIYLVRVSDDDPYYLDVIDYEKIKANQIKEYYTISKKGLCHYDNGKPLEFIVLANWLKERETYDQIKSLTFFTKFRKWKTLKMWKKNVIGHKTINYKRVLAEKLFILNPILRTTLLSHRKSCCDMEKLRFLDLNQQQYGLSADIPKLEEFKSMQEKKRKQVTEKIQDFSRKCRENIREGFRNCLDALRKTQYSTAFEDDFAKRNENTNLFRLKESAYENLGFPENLSYEKRSELRKECSKFLRFSYLVDFLAMEALKNIYVLSVEDLIFEFTTLVKTKEGFICKDKNQKGSSKNKEPMFFLSVDMNLQEIPENELEVRLIPEYNPPPLGTSKLEQDFNILYHVYTKPPKEKKEKKEPPKEKAKGKQEEPESDSDSDDEKAEAIDDNKTYQRLVCPNISRIWLSLKPNLDSFFSDIVRCLGEGMNAIQAFERWSRHDEMTPYVSVLEEWDDMVGDDWEMPDSNYLDPQDWLLDHSPLEKYSRDLKVLFDEAFARAEGFLDTFAPFLTIYWENSRVNLEIFKSDLLVRQSESIQYTLGLLNHQKETLEQEVAYYADMGLFKIDTSKVREEILPSPERLIKKMQGFMPELLKSRNKAIKDWLISANQSLKSGTGNLEEFVKQRNALKQYEKEYPKYNKRLYELNQVYMQLKDFHFEFKKDDDQAFVDSMHSMTALAGTMTTSNESIEKGLETNAMKITKQLIPDLEKGVNDLDFKVKDGKYLSRDIKEEDAIKELGDILAEFKKLEELGNKYREYQRTLGMDESDFENMRNLKEDLELRFSMWKSLREWKELTKLWRNGKFNEIDTEQIITKSEQFTNIIKKSQKKLPPNPILDELHDIVYEFKDTMPVVIALRNKHLEDYHWKEIKEKIGDFQLYDDFTLQHLINMDVKRFMKEIQEISVQATQEAILKKQYDEIMAKWLQLEFVVELYKSGSKELYALTEMDDIFAALDEYLANVNNILGSRYLKVNRKKTEDLHKKLLQAQEMIDDWLVCQKNWIYLENIFDSQDIKKKLANESQLFDNIDKAFRTLMSKVFSSRNVSKWIKNELGSTFKKNKETLNDIQKKLEHYLEVRRANFPRFYFLSNDELLEILAKAQDLQAIQKHMKKCFDNIYKLDLGEDPKSTMIYSMISAEGEKVEFNKSVATRGNEIETWLNQVQDQMRDTISKKMKIGRNELDNPNYDRKKWVLQHPGQVVAVISQIVWCVMTEDVLDQTTENPSSVAHWYKTNFEQLSQLTELVRSGLPDIKHKIIVALITQDVHARDIIFTLTNENVTSKTDFSWQQQLRYYWDESLDKENAYILQVNARMKYGYEYMGATSRLVITPLTDRCWITITGALNIKLGASPSGPAGTGKTESTKDLAKALGMLCVVFNCSEQIEYKMMARLFSGLVQQGAWSCLDEFNRIDIEVLSVIAQQLLTIRTWSLKNEKRCFFGTDFIPMRDGFGVFITMNPGYAGRTELPDNLKVLFRPVAMMIPDYKLIAEIILLSEGFENSTVLSNKMVQLYKLSSEQLSQQKHYDFGMRAVKSVLVMAGSLKRANPNSNEEDGVLIKAMRDSNIPKFLKEDIPLFNALIQDLFPDVVVPVDDYTVLSQTIDKVYNELGLQKVEKLTTKVIQLFETFNVRFGVMLVGLTGSAKTTCYQVLQNAMTELRKADSPDKRYQTVHTYILNPKCISMGELYGEANKFTQEWQDGLASQIMREAATDEATDKKNDRHWVVFDGPVDALWIENMNTVLDDNMMLCLANGQRIKLRHEMRMLFEVNDLMVASPATVSRCGMVYMTFEELGWRPYVLSWLQKIYQGFAQEELALQQQNATNTDIVVNEYFNKELKAYFWNLFEVNLDEGLAFLRNSGLIEPILTVDIQIISSFCNLLECFLNKKFGFKASEKFENKKRYLALIFAFSFIWSFGTTVYEDYHLKMDDFVRKRFSGILFPNTDTIFGFYLYVDSMTGDFVFKSWNDITKDFVFEREVAYFNLLVPTIDTVRYSFMIESLLVYNKKVFVTGGTGTGKSVIVKTLLRTIQEPRMIDTIFLMFSAATDSLITQSTIESKLERFKKNLIGAKSGRKMVIFIDDINMPAVEKYGAQPPIELLRLMIDRGGLYDRKERFWKEIQNTTYLAAAAPPTGGRNEMTPRFTRHFNLLCIPQPNQKILFKIFNSILSGFLGVGFVEAVKRSSDNVTSATIDVYQRIIKEKKAIPSKFHYTFNLRDVSKVFQGILMTRGNLLKETDQLVRLWIHEVSRVFYDRLVNDEDRDWFRNLIIELLGRHFNIRWTKEEIFINSRILFGDLLRLDSPTRDYEEIKDLKKLIRVLEDKMDDHNTDPKNKSKLALVFFEDAIEHILRVARVLRQPRGNLMLIGVGGSGKQSLTRLSSYLLNYQVRQVEIVKGYNQNSFREFLRELLKLTGVEGRAYTFLFTDTQIIDESFLEDINNMLNSGEVPNIWEAAEDKDKIINDVRPYHVNELKRPDVPDLIYTTFVDRVRDNLHIVLCMSPVGDYLRIRCRKFPSLVDCCTLDWFSSWPDSALLSVSQKLLSDFNLPSEEIRKGLVEMCPQVHLSAGQLAVRFDQQLKRKVYTTPKSYLDLINLYMQTLEDKREEISVNMKRLSNGLNKLHSANDLVADLKVRLTVLQPQLEEQSKKVEEALVELDKDGAIAREQELEVERDREEITNKAHEIKLIADEAKQDFDTVQPDLEAADKAIQEIDKGALDEMRKYPKPPKVVEDVMQGLFILMGKKYEWPAAVKLMQDLAGFINSLLTFPKDSIKEDIINKFRKHRTSPNVDFNPEIVRSKASAAADICTWCISLETYSNVNKRVGPKRAKVQQMEAKLEDANRILAEKEAEVNKVKEKVAKLKRDSDEMVQKKHDTQQNIERTQTRLKNAESLTHLLKDEGERWAESIKLFESEIITVVGDVFLSAACISYLGPFTGTFRAELTSQWITLLYEKNIPISSDTVTTTKTLGNPVVIRDWMMNGLPSDNVSQENAIFATKGFKWPLMIDPQLQANKWIKRSEEQNQIKVMKFSDAQFQVNMRAALTLGYPVLIQDTEEVLDPMMDNVFAKQFMRTNDGRVLIRFADSDLDYNNMFRLYMTTKKPNPNYLPEIFIKVNVINFTVTFEGLEEQLLADVVNKEQHEIEVQRDRNIVELADFKKKILESETNILKLLAEAKSDTLLDDVNLINTLQTSKTTSIEIQKQMKISMELEKTIESVRNQYREVSIRGSILYFVIKDLALIDPMYQYSLQYINRLFNTAIDQSQPSSELKQRILNLVDTITKTIFTNVCRGLFIQHTLIFSFMIAANIKRQNKELIEGLWGVFLRGAGLFDKENQPAVPDPAIAQVGWDLAYYLDLNFDNFHDLSGSISKQWASWKEMIVVPEPLEEKLPGDWDEKLDEFEHLLIIKIFRPEKLLFGCAKYVEKNLGKFYLESPEVRMSAIHADSDNKTPIIFVLSQGADPTESIINFAKERQFEENLRHISLGQGTEESATNMLEDGRKLGHWVFLQNCHLARTFMPKLEHLIDEINAMNSNEIHQEFRIFLTSMPADYFPVSVLQNGIKLTTEPPRGIKANMKRSFQEMTQEFMDSCNKGPIFHKLLWGLSYFHSLVLERRKFGPLGWNIKYEFNDSDLTTSKTVLLMLLNEQEKTPWDALLFVTGHINYGGRVTDDWDRRCLISILKKFYLEEILEEKYQFSDSEAYVVPPVGTVEDYIDYIDRLPITDDPDVFGMHENANINYQAQESDKIIQTILSIQPRLASAGGGKSNDEIILELVKDITEDVPADLLKEKGNPELFQENEQGLIPSLSTVLLQEMDRFNKLLSKMRSTLVSLSKAIQGFGLMSQELDSMYYCLLNNQVPKLWEEVAYPSLKPLASWITDLKERVKFMGDWLMSGNPNCFWISGFYFPQGFLTGVLQTHARKYKIPIDQLQFSFRIMDDKDSVFGKPQDGVYVYGLFLEGASLEKKKKILIDQYPGEMFFKMPVIHFNPSENYEAKATDYVCPVYKTSLRHGVLSTTGQSTNFILPVDLPTNDENTESWTLRGAAMLTQLNF